MNREKSGIQGCFALFFLCFALRFVEYFCIATDKTPLGENILHKGAGILLLALALGKTHLHWRDIGFSRGGMISGFLRGILLASCCFAVGYGLELAVLAAGGEGGRLAVYISGFSLTGGQTAQTAPGFFALCLGCNLVNVWMEEGLFRGYFLRGFGQKQPFFRANLWAAALFGLWHITMPVKAWADGEMPLPTMAAMSAGYILLAGMMGLKWGLLYRMTGNLWMGAADHLFNNTIATNMLHVVTESGADGLQILRVMAAQTLSLGAVAVWYVAHKTSGKGEKHP